MFPKTYFAAHYFAPVYFEPVDGFVPIVDEEIHIVGFLINFGTGMARR